MDLDSAAEALRDGNLYTATVLAARALLVTQGQEAKNDEEALGLYAKHFIDKGLVADSFRSLIERARGAAGSRKPDEGFAADSEDASALVEAVRDLYDTMDASLRSRPPLSEEAQQPQSATSVKSKGDREADFRGVVWLLNYVKAKLLLEQMTGSQVLSVLLDKEGARNVPESAKQDGHAVLSVENEGDHWRVLIRKS